MCLEPAVAATWNAWLNCRTNLHQAQKPEVSESSPGCAQGAQAGFFDSWRQARQEASHIMCVDAQQMAQPCHIHTLADEEPISNAPGEVSESSTDA